MKQDPPDSKKRPYGRRSFLKQAGIAGAAATVAYAKPKIAMAGPGDALSPVPQTFSVHQRPGRVSAPCGIADMQWAMSGVYNVVGSAASAVMSFTRLNLSGTTVGGDFLAIGSVAASAAQAFEANVASSAFAVANIPIRWRDSINNAASGVLSLSGSIAPATASSPMAIISDAMSARFALASAQCAPDVAAASSVVAVVPVEAAD